MANPTEEDLELLTDEEREALEGDDYVDEDEENGDPDEAAAAAADDDDDPDADYGDDGTTGDDGASADDPDPTAAAQDDAQGAEDDDPDDTAPTGPSNSEVDAQKSKVTELTEAADKLFEDFNDGEIDEDEYREKVKQNREDLMAAQRELGKLEDRAKNVEEQWQNAVGAHLKAYPDIASNQAFFDAMNAQVEALSKQPAFANKSFETLLKVAHGSVAASKAHLGIPDFPDLKTDGAKATPPKPTNKGKTPPKNEGLDKTPTTLRDVPASASTDPDESEFAKIDNLDVVEREAAIAAMTDAKRDEYLRYAS